MLKTWDIFDTLIARRCVFPHGVFQIVEQVSKVKGFTQARMTAEKNIADSNPNYNLDDIYEQFQKNTGVQKNICDALKKLECDVEFDQSIPITENIRQVKAGDILISDMYLPEAFVRRLLDKAELLVPVEIVITSGGKASGRVWKQLAKQKEFVFHIGDNQNTDVKNPRLAGFESALSILSNPNKIEQWLLQNDFNFGAYLREIRLRNPFTEEIKRLYWELFTLNIGVLLLLVQQLDALQKKYGFEYLGFCGRDTHYLRLLYEKYKRDRNEEPVPNDYLYYSRKLVRNSGKELAKYFAAKINGRKALMMDLIGTGTHLNNMRVKFGLNFAMMICLHHLPSRTFYVDMNDNIKFVSFPEESETDIEQNANFCFISYDDKFNINDSLESLNRSTHNSPVRLKTLKCDKKIFPKVIFSESNDTENFDVLENCFNEVLKSKLILPTISGESIEETLRFLLKALHSYSVQLPLRNQHMLIEQVDRGMLKVFENISAQRK